MMLVEVWNVRLWLANHCACMLVHHSRWAVHVAALQGPTPVAAVLCCAGLQVCQQLPLVPQPAIQQACQCEAPDHTQICL